MSLILGILAQGVAGAGAASSYESIATVTVGSGGSSTVTFSSIPNTYTHLQIRGIIRTNRTADDSVSIRFNSDSGSNYTWHGIYGTGSAAGAQGYTSQTATTIAGEVFGTTQQANSFCAVIVDVLDYANSNKYKTVRTLNGVDGNGYGQIRLHSGLWLNTNAITSITVLPDYGTAITEYSQFALYGIKGS